ncbi:hypothetical protein RDI58_021965 [Solanum bulbocastanum]|uniref:Uncharacterized protein n=1 Tax=Solanum bulbocastanum TaxID=147425 RepID=A0AAN8T9Q4_SOLBU
MLLSSYLLKILLHSYPLSLLTTTT